MKTIKLAAFAACAVMMLSACSADESTFNIQNVPGRANISGKIIYNQGTTIENGKFVYDYAPAANVMVFADVNNSSYDNNLTGTTRFTTTTDEEGKYEFEIPATNKDAIVTISTADFVGTQTSIERVGNEIKTINNNGVFAASQTTSYKANGINFCNMVCMFTPEVLNVKGYTQQATFEGTLGKNAEYLTNIQANYEETTNEDGSVTKTFTGFTDPKVYNVFVPAPNLDLIIKVNYSNGLSINLNSTTDQNGKFSIGIPVQQFPANITYSIEAMPFKGSFVHYVRDDEESYKAIPDAINEDGTPAMYSYYNYHPVNLDGYYIQKFDATGNLNFPMAGVSLIPYQETFGKIMIFNAFTANQDVYGYNPGSILPSETFWVINRPGTLNK